MAAPDSSQTASHPTRYYDWAPPGKPLVVHLNLLAVDGIRDTTFNRNPDNREVGGLLVGRQDHRPGQIAEVWVEDFLPIRLEHLITGSALFPPGTGVPIRSDQKVVGFYRTHNRSGLFLDDNDVALLQTHFVDPDSVALIVKPSQSGPGAAGFFFAEGHHVESAHSYLEFPFRRDELQVDRTQPPKVLQPPAPPPSLYRRASIASWLGLPLLTSLLVLIPVIVYKTHEHQRATAAANPDLGFNAQHDGKGLRLTWNRNHPLVREAQGGTLWITDGSDTSRLDLDSVEINSGTIVYWPTSPNVNFRLQIFAPGKTLTENLRTIGSSTFKAEQPVIEATPSPSAADLAVRSPRPDPPDIVNSGPVQNRTGDRRRDVSSRQRLRELPGDDQEDQETQPAAVAAANPPAPLNPPAPEIRMAAPSVSSTAVPPRPYHQTAAITRVSYEPVEESGFRRGLQKVPLLGRLQRHRKGGEDFTPAKAVKQVTPVLPITLRHALGNDEVDVDMKVEVDQNGEVRKTEIPRSDRHSDFVKLASDTLRHWRFEPARLKGKQVTSNVMVHFQFLPLNTKMAAN